jgi:hypothetical protein
VQIAANRGVGLYLPPVRRPTRIAILIAVAALAVGAIVGVASAAKKPRKKAKPAPVAFCSNPIVNDYLAPLRKLQPLPPVPVGGALPFATAGTTVAPTGPRLLVGGSSVGFRLANSAPAGPRPKRLNWIVLERLIRLTKEGQRLHPVALKRIDLAQLPAGKHRGLTFAIPPTPAVYSLEITIQSHRGRLLGRYGEYLRVVDRVANAGMTLSAYDNIPPGTTLGACFENHGTAPVVSGPTRIEHFEDAAWQPVAIPPQYIPATVPRTLGPGEAERLGAYLPLNLRPGLYRLIAPGTIADNGEPFTLSAEFGVL